MANWKISCFSSSKNVCVKWFNMRQTYNTCGIMWHAWHFFIWNTGIQKFGLLLDLLPCGGGRCLLAPVRYIARKRVEDTLSYDDLYVASLSPKTIVYKACWKKNPGFFVWAVRVGKGCTWNAVFGCLESLFVLGVQDILKEVFGCQSYRV